MYSALPLQLRPRPARRDRIELVSGWQMHVTPNTLERMQQLCRIKVETRTGFGLARSPALTPRPTDIAFAFFVPFEAPFFPFFFLDFFSSFYTADNNRV